MGGGGCGAERFACLFRRSCPRPVSPGSAVDLIAMNTAYKIAMLFGGVRELWRALVPYYPDLDPMTVYRWTYPRGERRGTGGRSPPAKLRAVVEIARRRGIDLGLTVEEMIG